MRKKSAGSYESGTSRHSVYQRGNQKEGSPHYVFLYSDDEFGDEDIPLQPRKQRNSLPKKVEVINVTLKPEDTLQALALRYRCTISELKRINNIHKENEIFARRTIKVPVQPFSIFTEVSIENGSVNSVLMPVDSKLIDLNESGESEDISTSIKALTNCEPRTLLAPISFNSLSFPSTSQSFQSSDINSLILNSLCEPLPPVDNENSAEDAKDDELLLSKIYERDSTPEEQVIRSFKCSGADWGLTWIHLLGLSILVGIGLPLIYLYLIAESNYKHESDIHELASITIEPSYKGNNDQDFRYK